ncbi:MAG TPA: hypothetical protein VN541_21380, partial [Tepidisphaeraceae bacterium]|nr:hypothetical protein [Tepidisphaeraceae bacterium]
MSRTSRRISRPLIAVLAVVIVLGTVFTIHKLTRSHASQTASAAPAQPIVQPVTTAPKPVTEVAKAKAPATQPAAASPPPGSDDSSALITQTPTARNSDNATKLDPQAQARVTGDENSGSERSTPVPDQTGPDIGHSSWDKIVPQADDNVPGAQATRPSSETAIASIQDSTPIPPHDVPTVQTEISTAPLADAKTRVDAGDLIAARQMLNDALAAGRLSESDADSAKKQIEEINKTLVFSPRKFPNDPWGGTHLVAGGERLGSIALHNGVSWELLARVNNVTPK